VCYGEGYGKRARRKEQSGVALLERITQPYQAVDPSNFCEIEARLFLWKHQSLGINPGAGFRMTKPNNIMPTLWVIELVLM
jgi:hypothetical protein